MKYIYHIIGWMAILLLPYLFAIKGSVDFRHLVDNQHEINNLLNYAFLIVFSYVNYLVLVPRLYLKRKYFFYFGLIALCFMVIVFLPEGFDSHAWPAPPGKDGFLGSGPPPPGEGFGADRGEPPRFYPGPPPEGFDAGKSEGQGGERADRVRGADGGQGAKGTDEGPGGRGTNGGRDGKGVDEGRNVREQNGGRRQDTVPGGEAPAQGRMGVQDSGRMGDGTGHNGQRWDDFGAGTGRSRPMIRYFAPPPPFFVEKSAIMLLFFVSIVVAISVQLSIYLQKTEKGQLNAELSYLKMQIHPHFLFNALNTIYSLSIRKDDRTPDAIIKLSELMRYVIRDAAHHKVSLDKELAYIGNYISLQQSGLAGTVRIDYRTEGDPGKHEIAPLILIPFIENAFKHGVNPDEETKIICHITIREKELQMLVSNRKVQTRESEPGGIGLQNAKERLQLLYPSRHTLTIADTPRDYTTQLVIVLT